MSELEDLEKKLYIGEDKIAKERLQKRIVLPHVARESPATWATLDEAPAVLRKKGKKLLPVLFGATVLAIIFLGAFFLFVFLGTKGKEAQVSLAPPETVAAGEVATIPVVVENLSRSLLQDVELTLALSRGMVLVENGIDISDTQVFRSLGDLPPGAHETIPFTVRIFGAEGETKKIEAHVLYRPENLRAQFSAQSNALVRIREVPLGIVWEMPEIVSRDQGITIRVKYASSAPQSFPNMFLRIDYPPGFEFVSSTPAPVAEKSIWELGSIEPGTEGSVEVRGTIRGSGGELKSFRAELGALNARTREWAAYVGSGNTMRVATVPLAVMTALASGESGEGVVVPGETLRFSIKYKNNTESVLKNISLRTSLWGDLFDLQTLVPERGTFDFASRSIVWNPGNVPELRELSPDVGGEFFFTVSLRATPQIRSDKDKNLVIRVESEISSGEAPAELAGTDLTSQEKKSYKVRSKVVFGGKALHRTSPILNSGPLPPRVGEKTTYTLTWEIRNFSNDLQNVEVKIPFPPNVTWEQQVFPTGSKISADAVASQIIWKAGLIRAGTGVLNPARTVSVQLGLTPSEADIGKSPTLVGGAVLTAIDSFTKEPVRLSLDPITTALALDPLTSSRDWEVVR